MEGDRALEMPMSESLSWGVNASEAARNAGADERASLRSVDPEDGSCTIWRAGAQTKV